jgi:hypothetical protein
LYGRPPGLRPAPWPARVGAIPTFAGPGGPARSRGSAVQCYAVPLTFAFHRLRLHFRATDAIFFPAFQSANILRGAFGTILREVVPPHTYARIFEPRAQRGQGPSGFADQPRPFVFRAAHLDARTLRPGDEFHFDVHSFDLAEPALPHFEKAFAELARTGLGPGRGRAELVSADDVLHSIDLTSAGLPVGRAVVRFVTPAELKGDRGPVKRPEFAILFARIRDRVSTLRALYGEGPLDIDFRAAGDRAAAVRMTRCELEWHTAERRSSRTGQRHPIGGFTGQAEYEGAMDEFLPYLEAGTFTGVGRQTVWGKGEIAVRI